MRRILFVAGALWLSGCGTGETPSSTATNSAEPPTTSSSKNDSSEPNGKTPATVAPARPDPTVRQTALLTEAREHVAAQKWDEAEQKLLAVREVEPSGELDAKLTAELEQVQAEIAAGRRKAAEQFRAENLARAQQLLDVGKLDEAQRALSEVLTRGPTDEQRATAQGVTDEIERRRRARRQLKSWMQLLASNDLKEVQTAQNQLLQDPDTALGMVLEALRATTSPQQATTYLETLGMLQRPDIVLPAYVEILQRSEQRELWPEIVRQLRTASVAGAGPALLTMARDSADAEQRRLALDALAAISDPPPETFLALTSLANQADDATAPLLLRAITHSAQLHGQRDVVASRGFDVTKLNADNDGLGRLFERVDQWAAPDSKSPVELRDAARSLALLVGRLTPQPLTNVKVARAEAEVPESPASAVLDGVWNAIDAKSMWRYPIDRRGSLMLDLGEERLVAGVRIWNWNEPSGAQRGWKEVELFVSATPAELTPIGTGIVPPAPGAAQTPDYGTFLPIPATRGRYVRLQAKSYWQMESHSGLAEVQVLGF